MRQEEMLRGAKETLMRTCNGEDCMVHGFRRQIKALGMAYSSTLKEEAGGFSETLVS
jgi:hypothetical protein